MDPIHRQMPQSITRPMIVPSNGLHARVAAILRDYREYIVQASCDDDERLRARVDKLNDCLHSAHWNLNTIRPFRGELPRNRDAEFYASAPRTELVLFYEAVKQIKQDPKQDFPRWLATEMVKRGVPQELVI